jgi:cytoskeleton protein RodZ
MIQAAEPMAAPVEIGPGRMLAQLRGEHKLSIADVAQRLKYGARQIEALEAEEFDKLPGGTFIRGMVRGYARLLDTDPQRLLDALDQRYVPGEIDLDLRDKGIPFVRSGRRGTRTYLALSILVFIVVAGLLYEWRTGTFPWVQFGQNTTPKEPSKRLPVESPAALHAEAPASVLSEPAQIAVVQAQQAPLSEGRIQLQFGSQSWVEIKEQDGKTLMSQLNSPGTRSVVVGRPPLSLVIGNAADVRLVYNGKPVDLKPYIQIEVARLTLK